VLARVLDDGTFSMLNSFSYMNHCEIVSYIQQNEQFLCSLFALWSSPNTTESKKYDVIMFLRELCLLAKSLQVANRTAFYRSMCHHGLFSIFASSLGSPDLKIRLASMAILTNILEHDSSLLRSYSLTQLRQNEPDLVSLIIARFLEEPDPGLKSQYAEMIRVVVDTAKPDTPGMSMNVTTALDSDIDDFFKPLLR